jgi:ATP-dependent DNA helicase PIF1
LAELLKKTSLILWDEAPMENKIFFEALDITLRDILRNKNENSIERPFGGMTMVVGEDFRQILLVLLKGRRHNIVTASIKRSYLRKHFHIMKLKRTLRLNSMSDDITVNKGQQNLQTGFSIFEMELIHHQKVKHFL